MQHWHFVPLIALFPVQPMAQPITGAQVVALITSAMQQAGVPETPVAAPIRAFPPCAHTPHVTAQDGDWSKAELQCETPQRWRRIVRNNAPAHNISPASDDRGPNNTSTQQILVATRPLVRGQRISAADLRPLQGAARLGSLQSVAMAEGRRLRVALLPDQPLLERHLETDYDVFENQEVTVQLSADGIEIAITAQAIENGWAGDRILVKPWNSDRIIQAQIVGPGRLHTSPNIAAAPAVKW